MSNSHIPSDCLLNRFVHTDHTRYTAAADQALIPLEQQPRLILRCVDRKAEPGPRYGQEEADHLLQGMEIGIYRSAPPLSVSCLSMPSCPSFTYIVAVDKNVMVLLSCSDDDRSCYFIYDSTQGSLRMIPYEEDSSFSPVVTSHVLIARPRHGGSSSSSYALVLPRKVIIDIGRERDVLLIWRPDPSSSDEMTKPRPSWSEVKKARFPEPAHGDWYLADVVFSSGGYAYWADLLRGVMCCSCKDILDDDDSNGAAVVEFGFIHLPGNLEAGGRTSRVSLAEAYRTMGVAGQDTVTFVSISGFRKHVNLKDRTVTIWRLLPAGQGQGQGQDQHDRWDMEHQLSLETLWGLDGFGGLPKDLTPMFPTLSKDDKDVLYIMLGECEENKYNWKFQVREIHYLLAVDLRKKVVLGATRLTEWYGSLERVISCDFNKFIRPVAVVEGAAKKSKTMQEEAYRVV